MPDDLNIPATWLRDLRAGLALLTRLPLPPPADFPKPPAVWAWPFAGLLVGGLALAAAGLALAAGLPAGLAAAVLLAVATLATGALHEDGLADCCDGFWGGWEPARRLEIMKDSHIGSYGVMGLVLVTLARWSATGALLEAGALLPLLLAAGLSRVPMAVLLAALPNARGAGLSESVGRPRSMVGIGAITLLIALSGGVAGLAMAVAVGLAGLAVGLLARRKIGGQTGDVLGASQQLAELAALTAACLFI